MLNRLGLRALAISTSLLAPVALGFDVTWHTLDGGGGFSAGGGFALTGTLGQPDARSHADPMTGGGFALVGGFWQTAFPSFDCGDCVGDITGDSDVDDSDLGILLDNYGKPATGCAEGDLNLDGVVNDSDLGLLLDRFGKPCGQ